MVEGSVSKDVLKNFIDRIENQELEKKESSDAIKEIYQEAKARGFDTKVMRLVVKLRKTSFAERQEQEAILDLYLDALNVV